MINIFKDELRMVQHSEDEMKNMIHIFNHGQMIVYLIDKIMIVMIRIIIIQILDNDLMKINRSVIEEFEIIVLKIEESVLMFHIKVELLLIIIKKLIDELILLIKHNVHRKLIIQLIKFNLEIEVHLS
jgi:hypothetical protein